MPNTRLVEVVKKCMSIQEEPKSIYPKKKKKKEPKSMILDRIEWWKEYMWPNLISLWRIHS